MVSLFVMLTDGRFHVFFSSLENSFVKVGVCDATTNR